MKERLRSVGCLVVAVCLLIVIGQLASKNQQLGIKNEQLLQDNEELEEFLFSKGRLVQLLEEGISKEGIPIVVTEMKGIPMFESQDKVDATVRELPVLLYYPESEQVQLHFEMKLEHRLEEWELYVTFPNEDEEVLVPPDPEKSYYYFLDLKQKGDYIIHVKDLKGSNDIYFPIHW